MADRHTIFTPPSLRQTRRSDQVSRTSAAASFLTSSDTSSYDLVYCLYSTSTMNLNTSQEGGAIQRYYQAIVDSQAPSSSSETYAKWALFSVTAPLASAFQQSNKDSVLKVQDSGGAFSDAEDCYITA